MPQPDGQPCGGAFKQGVDALFDASPNKLREMVARGRESHPGDQAYVCPAGLVIRGEYFPCDWMDQMAPGSPNHDGWAHANRAAEAIWTSDGSEKFSEEG